MCRLIVALSLIPATLALTDGGAAAASRARNVILFLADAGGISTVAAASLHGYGAPRRLFIQRMPNIALADTSSASHFVTDSAAGMTAIVVRGKSDGAPLKTILEYAEERGLSTGIITNDALSGATPAALYAKANDRGHTAVIFQQAFTPRFGDGPDVMIGAGRSTITKALAAAGITLDAYAQEQGRPVLSSLDEVTPKTTRAIVLLDGEFDLEPAVQAAVRILSRNRKGNFLMV